MDPSKSWKETYLTSQDQWNSRREPQQIAVWRALFTSNAVLTKDIESAIPKMTVAEFIIRTNARVLVLFQRAFTMS